MLTTSASELQFYGVPHLAKSFHSSHFIDSSVSFEPPHSDEASSTNSKCYHPDAHEDSVSAASASDTSESEAYAAAERFWSYIVWEEKRFAVISHNSGVTDNSAPIAESVRSTSELNDDHTVDEWENIRDHHLQRESSNIWSVSDDLYYNGKICFVQHANPASKDTSLLPTSDATLATPTPAENHSNFPNFDDIDDLESLDFDTLSVAPSSGADDDYLMRSEYSPNPLEHDCYLKQSEAHSKDDTKPDTTTNPNQFSLLTRRRRLYLALPPLIWSRNTNINHEGNSLRLRVTSWTRVRRSQYPL